MPSIDILVDSPVSQSARAQQICSMFDVPAQERQKLEWRGDLPFDAKPWNVGLIVGPSGCGKSTILRDLFGEPKAFKWGAASVIDDFAKKLKVDEIAEVCQAVGFNTIPAWLRPFGVLSNGERFRVEMARHLLETGDPIVLDEFTSVVDRQVAQIGAHAVQKFVRRHNRKFIAASCHYDVVDWLQPDWIFQPATMTFTWRELRQRPEVQCTIGRVPYAAWHLFAPFHYLTADLNPAARCFGLFVGDQIAAFAGILHRPHPKVRDISGCSRLVTLPDFQGLGLAFALIDRLGAAYAGVGRRLHTYPAHPSLVRSFDKNPAWHLEKAPGHFSSAGGSSSQVGGFGGRPNAVFSYIGPPLERAQAENLIAA